MNRPLQKIGKNLLLASALAAGAAMADTWAGWPSGGGAVTIPAGETVTVTDADAEGVAKTTSVTFGLGSTLVFNNTTTALFLNGNFINDGDALVRYTGTKAVVITADNTGWTGTNQLEGTSTLIVSNRYGLGTAATPKVTVAKESNLWFGGNGLTNDVPLSFTGLTQTRRLQHDRAYGPFVQNGEFVNNSSYTYYGDAIFNGLHYNSWNTIRICVDADRHVYFKGGMLFDGGYLYAQGPGTIHLDSQTTRGSITLCYSAYQGAKPPTIVYGVKNASRGAANWEIDRGIVLDLNGYDQSCASIAKSYKNSGNASPVVIGSAAAATLTISDTATTAKSQGVQFEGALGVTYSRAGKQTMTHWKSTSTGELKVTAGTLEFADGAGWGGDVVNVTGGTLLLSATEPLVSSNAVVTLDGGTLEIASGVTAAMRRLVSGTKVLKAVGTYSVADLTAAGYAGLAGEGSVFIANSYQVFSRTLDPNGSVTVTDLGDSVVVDGSKVAIPNGEELSLAWATSGLATTRYEFKADVASGELKVYSGETLLRTITSSGTYDLTAADAQSLRFVSAGEGVKIHSFTNKATITVTAADNGLAVTGGVLGENVVPAGGSLTLTIVRLYDSTMPTTGVSVNGTVYSFDDYPTGIPVTLTDADRGSNLTVSAVYATSITAWYVDCDNGDDANKGYFPECPKKTAQTVLDAAAAGSTVYLLPGVYSNGTTRVGSEKTLNRLVVPSGVNLSGYGNKEEIIVLGEPAPLEKQVAKCQGCGEDAVRCVYVMYPNAGVVRNLTLSGGRSFTDGYQSSATAYEGGAGVYISPGGGFVVDCLVSNCVANTYAAIRANEGTLVNTRVSCCTSLWHSVVSSCNLYGCVLDHLGGAYLIAAPKMCTVVNTTVGPGNSTEKILEGLYTIYNTILYGGVNSDWGITFHRTYFAGAYIPSTLPTTAGKLNDGCKSHDDDGIDIVLDETFTPVKGQCSSLDAGADYTSLYPEGYEAWALVDLYGRPRVLNGAIDVGTCEYDWRTDYAADVGDRFTCTAASTNVVENGGRVRLTDGAAVTLGWKSGAKVRSVVIPVGVTDGTVTVSVNGAAVATLTESADWTYKHPRSSDVFSFSYNGTASSEISLSSSYLTGTAVILK